MTEFIRRPVLAAEANFDDARHLVRCLGPLNLQVYLAASVEQALDRLRHMIFREAIAATELTFGGELLLARLSRLPAMKCLVAIGPADDAGAETRARAAGANVYLSRPVTTEMLALALGISTLRGTNE